MTLWGNEGGESLLGYTSNECIISRSMDGTLRTWDTQTGDEAIDPLNIDRWAAVCFAVARSGKCLAFGSVTGAVGIWELLGPTQNARQFLGHSDRVTSVSLSHDGDILASCSEDKTVRIWSAKAGEQIAEMEFQTNFIGFVVLSPDGEMVACGFHDRTPRLWNGLSGKPAEMLIHDCELVASCICFSPNSMKMAVGLLDGTISLWENPTGKKIATIRGQSRSIRSIEFSPDGAYLVSISEDTVRLWDLGQTASDSSVAVWTGHVSRVESATFSPDGRYIATASDDSFIQVWNTGNVIQEGLTFQGHHSDVKCMALSADGAVIVSGSTDCSIRVWDTHTGEPRLPTLLGHGNTVFKVAISPDARILASVSFEPTVRLWDAQKGTAVDGPVSGPHGLIHAVAISPDGKWLAWGAGDEKVYIWDIETRQLSSISPLRCNGWIPSVVFSSDSQTIAASDSSGTIHLWDTESGQKSPESLQKIGSDAGVSPIIFSPTGTNLAVGYYLRGHILDLATGKQIITLTGHRSNINSISYTLDGLLIGTGSYDCTVRLWNATTGIQVAVLRGHIASVTSVAFTPDGMSIVSGSEDSTIRVWDVKNACSTGIGVDESPAAAVESRGITDGWLLGEQGELLLWVPKDYRAYLDLPSCRLIIGRHKVIIKAEGEWYHGTDWTKCWIGPARL